MKKKKLVDDRMQSCIIFRRNITQCSVKLAETCERLISWSHTSEIYSWRRNIGFLSAIVT